MSRPPLTSAEIDRIIELKLAGLTMPQIALEIGCSKAAVATRVRRLRDEGRLPPGPQQAIQRATAKAYLPSRQEIEAACKRLRAAKCDPPAHPVEMGLPVQRGNWRVVAGARFEA